MSIHNISQCLQVLRAFTTCPPSESTWLPLAPNSTERGGDLQSSRMMRRFPRKTRHDPSSGHPRFEVYGPRFACARAVSSNTPFWVHPLYLNGILRHRQSTILSVVSCGKGRQGNCFTPSRRRRVSRWWSTCIGVCMIHKRQYGEDIRVGLQGLSETSDNTVPRTRRYTAKLDVIHATAACIPDETHILFDLSQWNMGSSER